MTATGGHRDFAQPGTLDVFLPFKLSAIQKR